MEVEEGIRNAHKMIAARSVMKEERFQMHYGIQARNTSREKERSIMSVAILFLKPASKLKMTGYLSYGYAFTSGALDDALLEYLM